MSHKAAQQSRNDRRSRAEAAVRSGSRGRRGLIWAVVLVAVAGIVTAMMLTSRPQSSSAARVAPDFTLTNTNGRTVRLSDYRGSNVVLYFSEGAGCQSCLLQMGEIERDAAAFRRAHVTVLPIVMNPRDQIVHDMALDAVRTPFLLDDGSVSRAYGTLGTGMHAGLPGHSFVLIDAQGRQRWYGEYPSMWLSPRDLLVQVHRHLGS